MQIKNQEASKYILELSGRFNPKKSPMSTH